METLLMPAVTKNVAALSWVSEMAELCQPDSIYWCDGSQDEKDRITQECLASGELEELNQKQWTGCYWSRSDIHDVARTEQLTFICTRSQQDAGITNNWMAPQEAYQKLSNI